jgi:hypothetical protein
MICAAIVPCLLAISAQAGAITYPDYASWNAAVSGTTTVTIPDPAPLSYSYLGSGSASVTYSGLKFSTSSALSDSNFFNIGSLFSGDPAVLSSQGQSFGVANILITLPEPDNAFAFDYGTYTGSDVTFLLSNGDTIIQGSTGSFGYLVPDFFGVTDTTSFTSVLVTTPDNVLDLNNLSRPVPEPASMALLGTALIAFGVTRRRRKTVH